MLSGSEASFLGQDPPARRSPTHPAPAALTIRAMEPKDRPAEWQLQEPVHGSPHVETLFKTSPLLARSS
jgi:hypothetical protein